MKDCFCLEVFQLGFSVYLCMLNFHGFFCSAGTECVMITSDSHELAKKKRWVRW